MDETLKEGYEVELKSGSPKMIIEKITNDDALCVWFHNNEPRRETFKLITLKPYKFKSNMGGI